MSTLFTKIIDGELPGRFVWRDDEVVSFLTINPITFGHALVVPVAEVEQWLDLPVALAERCMAVAQVIGQAQMAAFSPTRVGLVIAGLEVPHTHLHLVPFDQESDLSFAKADPSPDPARLDQAAGQIRAALSDMGRAEVAS